MKLRTRLNLTVFGIFAVLAVVVGLVTQRWLDRTAYRDATARVRLDIDSFWHIYDDQLQDLTRAVSSMAPRVCLAPPAAVPADLERLRQEVGLDLALVTDGAGRVLARSPAGAVDDTVAADPRAPVAILQAGLLVNGESYLVDQVRDLVFQRETCAGKPLGTATIFLGDQRIATNVTRGDGARAVGTRVSKEVAENVLLNGKPWTGRAWVVDAWRLSQHDPIRDPDGRSSACSTWGSWSRSTSTWPTRPSPPSA